MNKKQSYPVFYLNIVLYMIVALVIRAVALAPLAAVILCKGALKALALLTLPLLVFLVYPLRFSFADVLVQDSPKERCFSVSAALSFKNYQEKLKRSLQHALRVLLWGIPMYALLGYYYHLYVSVDILNLMSMLKKAGMFLIEPFKCIGNLFLGLFNQPTMPLKEGVNSMAEGILVVLILIGIAGVIWLYGAVRNSAFRYIWAMAKHKNSEVAATEKAQLKGRRWKQLLIALVNLVLTIPFFVVAWLQIKDLVSDLSTNLITYMYTRTLPVGNLIKAVLPVSIAFIVLYFLLIPARRYRTCQFATAAQRHKAPKKK